MSTDRECGGKRVGRAAPDRLEEHVFALRVQPGAAKTGPAGMWGELPKLKVASPPVDGAANEAVVEFVARSLDIPKSAVEIIGGLASRTKRIRVRGVAGEKLRFFLTSLGIGPRSR